MPKVSIIIPTYNYGQYIGSAVKSIIDQTYKDVEIVIVDDNSTDDTYDVLKPYFGRICYIRNKDKGGIVRARLCGIHQSTGEFIGLLDADDIYMPDKLEIQAEFLEKYPNLDFVFSDFSEFDNTGTTLKSYVRSKKWFLNIKYKVDGQNRLLTENVYESYLYGDFIHPSTMLMRRKYIEDVGFMDDRYPVREVYAKLTATLDRLQIGYTDKILVNRRVQYENLSSGGDIIDQTSIQIFQRLLESKDKDLSKRQKKFINRQIALGHYLMGRRALLQSRPHDARRSLSMCLKENPFHVKARLVYGSSLIPKLGKIIKLMKTGVKK